jgi:hypothetical protein
MPSFPRNPSLVLSTANKTTLEKLFRSITAFSLKMSTSYTISIENNRGANTNYATFMDSPEFTGGLQPSMNVWYTSFVPHGGSFELRTGMDFYACK